MTVSNLHFIEQENLVAQILLLFLSQDPRLLFKHHSYRLQGQLDQFEAQQNDPRRVSEHTLCLLKGAYKGIEVFTEPNLVESEVAIGGNWLRLLDRGSLFRFQISYSSL